MLLKKIIELLENREFISVATCDFKGRPNAAPKFFLKFKDNFIYLVDYTIGMTWDNLKINPKASLSLMDPDTLMGYQINGSVEIIEKGQGYDSLLNEFRKKGIDFSAKRIIEGVSSGKGHKNFEVSLPEHVVVFKIKLEDFSEIGPRGELKREKI
jgi:uncharacterized protein